MISADDRMHILEEFIPDDMRSADRHVLWVVACIIDDAGEEARPDKVARGTGMSERRAAARIADLIEWGFMAWDHPACTSLCRAGNDPVPSPFVARWREAIFSSDLPQTVRHVGLVMAHYADTNTGRNVRPGADRVARGAGMSVRHVKRCRAILLKAGFLEEIVRGGSPQAGLRRASVFALTIPAKAEVQTLPATKPDEPLGQDVRTDRLI